jgi:hypothetical protein
MSVEAKQVYEWVKTGHWSLREFKDWLAEAEPSRSDIKQEPYGWVSQHTTKGVYEWQFNKELSGVYKDTAISILPVYTHPYTGQPKENT